MEDEILIKKYLSWDEKSLDVLLRKHLQSIFSISYRICLDYDDASDICQNILIKIIKNLKNFQFKSQFKTWYFRIAYNETINYLKNKKININLEKIENYDLNKEKIDENLSKKELKKKLTDTINKLPLIERNILLYYYYDELKIKEISYIMQINENTIKTKLKRSKNFLHSNFEKYEKFD